MPAIVVFPTDWELGDAGELGPGTAWLRLDAPDLPADGVRRGHAPLDRPRAPRPAVLQVGRGRRQVCLR